METLHDVMVSKGVRFTPEEKRDLNNRLLLLAQLSTLQENVCSDVERIFKEHGFYRFDIKHNHKQIKRLVKTNFSQFFDTMSPEQLDMYCNDADDLQKLVNKWAGINDKIL